MLTYFWIGLGSAIGGIGRYWCSGFVARSVGQVFPWGTITVNVIGSAVIGFLAAWLTGDGRILIAPDVRAFLMIGVCGGFTTFSSFSLETLNLLRDGEWTWAAANVVLSVTVCLIAVWLGFAAAAALNR